VKRDVTRGALWSLLEAGSTEGVNLVAFIVLSRLLEPADYGVAMLASVVSTFVQTALVRGLSDAVASIANLDEDEISTAFWANLGLAAVLFVLVQLGAGVVAWCFGQPLVAPVLRWMSLCFFTTALTTMPLAALRRQLRLEAFAARGAVATTLGGLVGIVMAFKGYGAWSLVGTQIGQGMAGVATVWLFGGWRPRKRLSWATLRKLSSFSIHSTAGAALDFVGSRIDVVVIGFALDAASVGYYSLLKRVLHTAMYSTMYPIWAVMTPALGRLVGDWNRFNRAYISLVGASQVGWVLVVTGLGAVASDLLPLLFGPHWTRAVPLFQVASILAVPYAIVSSTSRALAAAGHARAYLRLGVLQVVSTAVFAAVLTHISLAATGLALVLSSLAVLPFHLYELRRYTGMQPVALLLPCMRIAMAGGVMWVVLTFGRLELPLPRSAILLVSIEATSGLASFLAALRCFSPDSFAEAIALMRSLAPRPGPRAAASAPSPGISEP
jgi:O-antigen/teichoic acid export membrane protein